MPFGRVWNLFLEFTLLKGCTFCRIVIYFLHGIFSLLQLYISIRLILIKLYCVFCGISGEIFAKNSYKACFKRKER